MLEIKICPICGSKRIAAVTRTLVREFKGRRYEVPDVEFHECSRCGEQLFDRVASRKIDEASPGLRRRVRERSA